MKKALLRKLRELIGEEETEEIITEEINKLVEETKPKKNKKKKSDKNDRNNDM